MKPILLFLLTCAMWGQGKPQKFYITGLAHSPTANDCTIPPIVAYGKDRVDALLHCCEGGGLTVWSEVEYQKMRQDIGREFDESCKAAPKPAVSRDKPIVLGTPIPPSEEAWHVTNPQNVVKYQATSQDFICFNGIGIPTIHHLERYPAKDKECSGSEKAWKQHIDEKDAPLKCPNGFHEEGDNCMAPEIPYSNWKTDPQRVFNSPPAPKPSFTVEKAVAIGNETIWVAESAEHDPKWDKTDWERWPDADGQWRPGDTRFPRAWHKKDYGCKSQPGYSTFLLPDESTGEKVCLNVLKEKP